MIVVRLAVPEDAPVLAKVRQKAWDSAYRGIYPDELIDGFDYKVHAEKFRKQITSGNSEVYVIADEDVPVGYLVMGKTDWYKDFSACLRSLYLIPEYHRRGIGRKMMEFAKEWCRQRGYRSFFNSCNLHNQGARAFYEAMGGALGDVDDGNDDPGSDQCFYEYYLE